MLMKDKDEFESFVYIFSELLKIEKNIQLSKEELAEQVVNSQGFESVEEYLCFLPLYFELEDASAFFYDEMPGMEVENIANDFGIYEVAARLTLPVTDYLRKIETDKTLGALSSTLIQSVVESYVLEQVSQIGGNWGFPFGGCLHVDEFEESIALCRESINSKFDLKKNGNDPELLQRDLKDFLMIQNINFEQTSGSTDWLLHAKKMPNLRIVKRLGIRDLAWKDEMLNARSTDNEIKGMVCREIFARSDFFDVASPKALYNYFIVARDALLLNEISDLIMVSRGW